ncbi:conserved hypothetical protein [Pseudomonas veronii]|uniref:restriction endonuclease n=1 Tax=Pseudomonas veronii TaxID=76761 RepID=UPI0017597360|nr:restriction endonuclease [Pseudomonas veronii]CAD0266071.1 conserved hypothetical protein [Pseudomonas veronii]
MARRRKTSLLDDLLNIAMKIPLWANVVIAGGSFALLRYYGGADLPTMDVAPGGELAQAAVNHLVRLFAYIGQYVIPPIFLLGGIFGWIQRAIRARKFKSISTSSQPGVAIRNLTWEQFEQMVGEAFRKQGYAVDETVKGPDGGIDLVLRRGGELFLVQCKQWKAAKVSVQVVRELYGVMSSRGAAGGFVVTSGSFTKDAWKFAKGTSVHLVDGTRLVEWFKPSATKVQPTSVGSPTTTVDSLRDAAAADAPTSNHTEQSNGASDVSQQACPQCGGGMIPRYRRATNNGISNNVFLGCQKFPACRGTRQLVG